MEGTLSDYDIAWQLHLEMNDNQAPVLEDLRYERHEGNSAAATAQPGNGACGDFNDIIDLSESLGEASAVVKTRARSRSPLQKVKTEVEVENQEAITIQKEKTSPNDYYMPLMNTYIDLGFNQEWAEVNMEANLQQMFDKMKGQYFSSSLKAEKYTIRWDKNGTISDDSCFRIFASHNEILIRPDAMVRPRIQLISVIFHILIHIYLKASSKGSIQMNAHDENFRKIMLFLNNTLKTQIKTFHKYLDPLDENVSEYAACWYRCTGVCQAYEPFHGTLRCTSIPDKSHFFFKAHEEACGGQFFKIFEMARYNNETGVDEKMYVRNVRYMYPKARCVGNNKGHLKTNGQVRELFDLTDDAEVVAVQNLCDVIDLDAPEFQDSPTASTSTHASAFTKQPPAVFSRCPFCSLIVGSNRFESHVDCCRGYQQKVVYNAKVKM